MCNCVDVTMGSYNNQVMLEYPPHMQDYKEHRIEAGFSDKICVDACLEKEIKELWNQGIMTTGCCCGHNKSTPYIGVFQQDIKKMVDMGYIITVNFAGTHNIHRMDSFFPKSIKISYVMWRSYFKHADMIIKEYCVIE